MSEFNTKTWFSAKSYNKSNIQCNDDISIIMISKILKKDIFTKRKKQFIFSSGKIRKQEIFCSHFLHKYKNFA
jgi:hypothetical protein